MVDNGANGGLKGDAGVVAGVAAGGGAAMVGDGLPGSLRAARRAGLGWRPSTVTCGMSISVGAFGAAGGPAVVAGCGCDGCAVCDGAGSAGACPVAGDAAGAGVSTGAGVAAGDADGAGVAVCESAAAWPKHTMANADVPRRAIRVARISSPTFIALQEPVRISCDLKT